MGKNKEAGAKKEARRLGLDRRDFLITLKREPVAVVSNSASEDLTLKTQSFKESMMG